MTINIKAERKRSVCSLSNADATGTGQALFGPVSHITFNRPGSFPDRTSAASRRRSGAGERHEARVDDRLAAAAANLRGKLAAAKAIDGNGVDRCFLLRTPFDSVAASGRMVALQLRTERDDMGPISSIWRGGTGVWLSKADQITNLRSANLLAGIEL